MAVTWFSGVSRPASWTAGRGAATPMREVICRECGDLDYRQVSPGLQRIRGPYPLAARVAAYEEHLLRHDARQAAHPGPADLDTCQKAGGTDLSGEDLP